MHKKCKKPTEQKQKSRQQYASDFKDEIIRMLNSGKKVKELSKRFGIGENVLYNWKMKSKAKVKTKTNEEQSDFSLKLISENERLKKENAQLTDERDMRYANLAARFIAKDLLKFFETKGNFLTLSLGSRSDFFSRQI